ncbi:MAG: DUF3311 domain-containing protein [Alphaproteobacteria bacterium]
MPSKPRRKGYSLWVRLLALIPFAAYAWVPFYNRIEPELAGVPFFYWYQLLWVVIGALLLGLAYVLDSSARGDAQ